MKMKQFNLKEYLHYNLVVMKYLGLWPEKDYTSDKFYLIYTIIVNGFFNFGMTVGLTGYILTSSNLLEDAISAGYIILGIMATAKSFFIMKYSHMFKLLVDEEIHKSINVTLNDEQNKILCDYVGFWKRIHANYSYLSVVIFFNYITMPIFSKTPYTLPLNSWFPFDYKQPVVYEIVYFHQSVSALIDIFVNLNGATLAAGFLAYLSAECDVLVDLLRNLNNGSLMKDIDLDTERLKICIEYHKKIVQYSKYVESYFSKYLLIQFASSCISTALIMTSLSKNHDVNVEFWFLGVLQLGVWADLYIYCWYGNEVTEKSKQIPYAAFESDWVAASKIYKKDLLFFICRTQKPIKIYAVNFFELSLGTFIGILRMAYSYYMLLSQLSKDE